VCVHFSALDDIFSSTNYKISGFLSSSQEKDGFGDQKSAPRTSVLVLQRAPQVVLRCCCQATIPHHSLPESISNADTFINYCLKMVWRLVAGRGRLVGETSHAT